MKVFNNALYLGCNGVNPGLPSQPAELIRIKADDSWDVVVGKPRDTPAGRKLPISGLSAGFGNIYNLHMWRMEVFEGRLYVGTFDVSTSQKNNPSTDPNVRANMGFDLYRTTDGVSFEPVTTTGFGDKFNFGLRTLQATPYGLFLGTANYYYGLNIYWDPPPDFRRFKVFLPISSQTA